MEDKRRLVRVASTGYKALVEYVATVNKVKYYVQVGKPEKVYTALEVREIKSYK